MSEIDDSARDAEARRLLAEIPGPSHGASARVAARLERTLAAPAPRSRLPMLAAAAAPLALAAAAVLYLGVPSETPPMRGPIASEATWGVGNLSSVHLTYRGVGEVAGPDNAPEIQWQRGVIHVEVQPEKGIDLRVRTREAEVRVVGTGFTVRRDALGTEVDVRHGKVETTCEGESPVLLAAGESRVCLPRSAAGLLGRAHALADSGGTAAATIEALDLGLALATPGEPVRDELLALKIDVLRRDGQAATALDAAREVVTAGSGLRRDEVLRIAAGIALDQGGCASSAPWLLEVSGGPEACGGTTP